jgi:hypothetical protein
MWLLLGVVTGSIAAGSWWPASVEQALVLADSNRVELVRALNETPAAQRTGLQFLLTNMPPRDLKRLSAKFLRDNLALAYQVRATVPWGRRLPEDVFLNDVLPYANLNEPRDNWRKRLYEIAAPLVKDCQTPGEAAQRLNQKLFGLLKVRYSTQRHRPDQGPFETMATGVATCTGLSILLVDACRAVGVPARVVGTPLWANNSGNHTWVEVWDNGWHFMGAAEPDPEGLDHGWFVDNASHALKDAPEHAIYASSFAKTGLAFPLVWAPRINWVNAVNVTDRYAASARPADTNATRLLVRVLDRPVGQRVTADVVVTDPADGGRRFTGISRGETADMNDALPFELAKNHTYQIAVTHGGAVHRQFFTTGTNAQDALTIFLGGIPPVITPAVTCAAPPAVRPLDPRDGARLQAELLRFFSASTNAQAVWQFSARLERLLLRNEAAVRQAAWTAFRAAPVHAAFAQNFAAHRASFDNHVSPFTVRTVGVRPAGGWALFIAMHGGGGAPKEVNDSQWRIMQHYYRDHPEVGGYYYVALRAPNDTWNGFYDVYVYPLVANLVREFLLFGGVNPDKVFLMGYSHGGYGAFAIGPKEPDLFAAIHASAGAPTDGETTGKTLRHTVFTCMVGEKDTMYGRIERDRKFAAAMQALRGDRTDIYPVTVQVIPGNGHTGLPDRDKIAEMYSAVRNPVPRDLTWLMTDTVITDFFWLHTDVPGKAREIDAACRDNRLTVTTTPDVPSAAVFLDGRLVDFSKPVTLECNGQSTVHQLRPSLRTLCLTLQRRGDPELAFTVELPLPLAAPQAKAPVSQAP